MKTIDHSTLSKPIYDRLKAMILKHELKPGEKIIQEKIAAQLGVSRTPLMRALLSLEHESLVESVPRRGMFVKKISFQEMIDIYYCREGVECVAVRLATERSNKKELESLKSRFLPFISGKINIEAYKVVDEKFHNEILRLANNPVLEKMSMLSQLHNQVYSMGLLRSPEETLAEHLRIIDAMLERNSQKAEIEMKEHIRLSRIILEESDLETN